MWQLTFFGGLRADNSERIVERFRTQKTAALLAFLALKGPRNREEICALLWPDAAPEAARNSLSAALSALRRELGDDNVSANRVNVALAPSAFRTDVADFGEALKNSDFARAVELYRGPLLPGFHEDPFPALARELEEQARVGFSARLEELEQNGECDQLLALARRAASLFGDSERWFLALMRAHYGLGDFDAALKTYESLGRFARKNGDTTSESARILARTIRRDKEHEASMAALPPRRVVASAATASVRDEPAQTIQSEAAPATSKVNLPVLWTRFFGREAERGVLLDWLQKGEKLVTLSGAGGSGKTRLALEMLRQLASDFDGEIAFVPLAALPDADLILPAIRDALGLAGAPDGSPLEHLERALRGRRAVLFLDNFEQLVGGGAAHLQSLRERLPDAQFLITSRVLLQLPGEREFPVAPLPTPLQDTSPSQVAECASAALFCDRAGLVLDAANASAVGALCRRLDGIPLALELGAARAKVLSPAQILERLQKHPDFLRSRELGIPARHKTLRATIEWSTDLLSPALRDFWLRLSLFHGGWTLEAAEKITAPGVCEEWETLDWLTLLRECSLVFVEERADGSRFRMLQTLREFGREALVQSEEVERLFFDYFLELGQQAASAMQGAGQTAWLARLDAEQDNLRAALNWAREHDATRGLQLATSLIEFWETRLSLDEGRHWIETFLRATEREDTSPSRARALSGAGRLAWYASDMKSANLLLEQGLQAARQTGDKAALVYATRTITRLAAVDGEATRALEIGSEGVRLARASGDKSLLLKALMDLAFAEFTNRNFDAVVTLSEEAKTLATQLGDESALALALTHFGCARDSQGRLDEALDLAAQGEAICRRLGLQWELLVCLALQAQVLSKQGEFARARPFYQESLIICRDTSLMTWHTVTTLLSVSWGWMRRGDAFFAVQIMAASHALSEAIGYTLMPALLPERDAFESAAREQLGQAEFERAWTRGHAMTPAEAIDFALNAPSTEVRFSARARALSGAARLAWHDNDINSSRDLVSDGLEAARKAGDTASLVYAVAAFVRFAMSTGDTEGFMARARLLSEESVERSRREGDKSLLLESLISLGYAHTIVSNFAQARIVNDEAIAIARELGDETRLARTLNMQAGVYFHQQIYPPARAILEESVPMCRRLNSPWDLIAGLWTLSGVAREQGQLDLAGLSIAEVLEICRATPTFRWGLSNVLLTTSFLFVRRGETGRAVRLMAMSEAIVEAFGYQIVPVLIPEYHRYKAEARELLSEREFAEAWEEGRVLSPDAAIDEALSG